MKRCPQCNRAEADDTLTFCRVDGTPLVRESGAPGEGAGTLRFGSAPVTGDTETRILPTGEALSRPTAPTTVLDAERVSGGTQELGKPKSRRGVAIAAAVIAVALAASAYLYLMRGKSSAAKNSIAVLPFQNASDDSEMEYLSDGISENLINSLSRLPNVRVIARSTMFRFKGKDADPQAVGKQLGVDAVLTGRVVQRGDSLTVQADLVSVSDGSQMWGERYSRKASDVLAVQEDIASEIVTMLQLRLNGVDQNRLTKRYTENSQAYQLYLKGRYQQNKRTEGSLRKSIEFFNLAIETDPTYALAHAGLADSYNLMGVYTLLPPKDAFPKAKAAAETALGMDNNIAEAHTALAIPKSVYEWKFDEAEAGYERAIELNPNYPAAHEWYGYNMFLANPTRAEEAMRELEAAKNLDPLSQSVNFQIAALLYFTHRYDEGIKRLEDTLKSDPDFTLGYGLLSVLYREKGMRDESVAARLKGSTLEGSGYNPKEIERVKAAYDERGFEGFLRANIELLKEQSKQKYVSPVFLAMDYAVLGEKDAALSWLEKAVEERSSWLAEVGVDPVWDTLRSDPRFAELVRRVGLPQ